MSGKRAAASKKDQPDKPKTIFVSRERLSLKLSLTPPTDEQRSVLVSNTVHKWPGYYEIMDAEPVIAVLREMDLVWAHKK